MDRLVFLLVVIAPLHAQFTELATTDDGSQLYFSSTLTLTTAVADYPESRIYKLTGPNSTQLFAERGARASTFFFGSGDGARHPQVSGNGSLAAFTLANICESQPPCLSPVTRTVLQGIAAEASFNADSAFLSSNGRYLLLTNPPGPPPANITPPSLLRDLQTGETRDVPPSPMIVARPIASDGTVVIQQSTGVALWKDGLITAVPLQGPFSVWGISDNASVLLYMRVDFESEPLHHLIARNLLTGKDTVIFTRPPFPITGLGLSNDGSRVFFRTTDDFTAGTAWIGATSAAQLRPISLDADELVTEGTLSGDGRWAFAVTTNGRLVKVDAATGAIVETLVPSTPYVTGLSTTAPGSYVSLSGAGLNNSRVLLDDSPVHIIRTTPTNIALQIPWEIQPSSVAFRLAADSGSPFRQSRRLLIAAMAPLFRWPPFRPDFTGSFFPRPGDDFVLYATGLGAVDGPLATGQPTPSDRLYRITGEFRCRFFPYQSDAILLFAGLAPGYTGIYQLNFRLPDEPVAGRITGGTCTYGANGTAGSISFVIQSSFQP